MMAEFLKSLPKGFYKTISRKTVFCSPKNTLTINEKPVIDQDAIFCRAMVLISTGELDIRTLFASELAVYPPSLFFPNGEPRYCTSKSDVKREIQENISRRSSPSPDSIIVDASALLWSVMWPSSGSVKDFANGFMKRVTSLLLTADVYLIFDRYRDNSIKNCTRYGRLSSVCTEIDLTLDTPLPTQNTVLKFTKNKVKLIRLLVEFISQNVGELNNKLIITANDPVPVEIHKGVIRE